jgi:hypothetical protein
MTLPASGQITLNQVNVELGNSGTAQIGLGDAAVRGLFGIASGEIEMADGYGKSAVPWSIQFPNGGSNNYVTAASSTDFGLGTGNYTLEWWHYQTVNDWVLVYDQDYGNVQGISIWIDPNQAIAPYFGDGTGQAVDPTPNNVISLNSWHHIAVVRNGSTVNIYVDGVSQLSSTTLAVNLGTQSQPFSLAALYGNASYQYDGYLSQVRLVKGTAVYTSNFTAPTTALTNISGTVLLTAQNSTIVDNSSTGRTLTVTGTVTPTQSQVPF